MPRNPAACPSLNPTPIPKGPITNMRKWGVSNFGALSAFDFQPKNADSEIKVSN
jgi:hypothetical protein